MGEAHHSSTHKTAKDHIGKKVVVVGAANSGLDVCADFAAHGIDEHLSPGGRATFLMLLRRDIGPAQSDVRDVQQEPPEPHLASSRGRAAN
jgi:cation diffusion facilitator CzcD-associated flavoprotein CzcO